MVTVTPKYGGDWEAGGIRMHRNAPEEKKSLAGRHWIGWALGSLKTPGWKLEPKMWRRQLKALSPEFPDSLIPLVITAANRCSTEYTR